MKTEPFEVWWSVNEEYWNNYSKEECINDLLCDYTVEELEGMELQRGVANTADCNNLVDSEDIITMLNERACDNFGESAEDYPDVSNEAQEELTKLISDWITKHAPSTFYAVSGVEIYKITKEDLEDHA